ncbi:ankyrin repeat domain-containing protein [Sodalis praecaptivus]|nr:ankyrin repeat domain-containing protein [Sodalis praecaptivus]
MSNELPSYRRHIGMHHLRPPLPSHYRRQTPHRPNTRCGDALPSRPIPMVFVGLLLLNQLSAVIAVPEPRSMPQTRDARGVGALRGTRIAPSSQPLPGNLAPGSLFTRAPKGSHRSALARQPACASSRLPHPDSTPRPAHVEDQLKRPIRRTKRLPTMHRLEETRLFSPVTPPPVGASRCRAEYTGARHTPPAPLPLTLSEAAEQGDIPCVNAWLRNNPAIDAPDAHHLTALQHAVRNGRAEAVDALLNHNASLTVVTPNRETLLHLGVLSGNHAVVQAIAARGSVDSNLQDERGWTPLMYAVHQVDIRLCQVLLNVTGIDVNSVNPQHRTALWLATDSGRAATMAALICREDIDVNCADMYGASPLMCATRNGKVDRQALLLSDARTDVNRQDQNGMTALMIAISKKNPALHRNILAHPATDAALRDAQGNTALHLAMQQRRLSYVVDLLAQHGAAVNAVNLAGDSPLHIAASNGKTAMVRRLLRAADIDVDRINHAGLTPAMCALSQGHDQIVRLIFEHRDRRYREMH